MPLSSEFCRAPRLGVKDLGEKGLTRLTGAGRPLPLLTYLTSMFDRAACAGIPDHSEQPFNI